jgi:Ca2+-binding RTX toxin-like protein
VKKQLALLVLGFVSVLLLAGQLARAAAGPGPADPQDSVPAWASDGVHLAFERTTPSLQHVLTMTSAGKDLYVAWPTGESRGYVGSTYFLVQTRDQTIVTTGGRFAGPNAILHGTDAAASPDGSQIAYIRAGTLYVVRASDIPRNGAFPIPSPPERAIATGVSPPSWDVTGPAWSPDGTRIAVASGSSLLVVNTDGSGKRTLFAGGNQSVNPSWSHDGKTVAFETNGSGVWAIWEVQADATGAHAVLGSSSSNFRFPQFSPVSDALAFISDRQRVPGGATQYQYALFVDRGNRVDKLVDDVRPDSPPRWSPTAALIAVAAGQECRRWGVYTVRSEGGTPQRHSNLCRFTGTSGDDTVRGSYYFDLIRGLGGNDRILAFDGNDRIEGDAGNDVIAAGNGNDVIFGGPGDDVLYGGAGNDVIVPGNGRDRVDCGPGDDTVEGAGPLDRIAKNCEHVHR